MWSERPLLPQDHSPFLEAALVSGCSPFSVYLGERSHLYGQNRLIGSVKVTVFLRMPSPWLMQPTPWAPARRAARHWPLCRGVYDSAPAAPPVFVVDVVSAFTALSFRDP